MEPNRATGEDAPARQEGNATATDTEASDADNVSQATTLACPTCDSTNLTKVHGETVAGAQPEGDGPYRCNNCGTHAEPVERPKGHTHDTRSGLAGRLASADAEDLVTDGGTQCAECGANLPEEIDERTGVYCSECGHGQLVTDGGEDVEGCPECRSSNLNRRIGPRYGEDEKILCRDCRHTFGEPLLREPKQPGGNRSEYGKALLDADSLDDLRADGGGFDITLERTFIRTDAGEEEEIWKATVDNADGYREMGGETASDALHALAREFEEDDA